MDKIPYNFEKLTSQYETLFFVHVPKTAGSYLMNKALRHELGIKVFNEHNHQLRNVWFNIPKRIRRFLRPYMMRFNWGLRFFIGHPVCTKDVLNMGGFPLAWVSSCYNSPFFRSSLVFSVVRNPFDLLVSMYTYGFPYWRKTHNSKNSYFAKHGFPFQSFRDFVKAYCNEKYPWIVKYQQNFLFFQLFDDEGKCCPQLI
jgi:hypothetical protein